MISKPVLSRNVLDLATQMRADEKLLDKLVNDPQTEILVVRSSRMSSAVLVCDSNPLIARVNLSNVNNIFFQDDHLNIPLKVLIQSKSEGQVFFLGYEQNRAYICYVITQANDPVLEALPGYLRQWNLDSTDGNSSWSWLQLRRFDEHTNPLLTSVAGRAVALQAWHDLHRFCSICGKPAIVSHNGWASVCTNCSRLEYPRQDPVVITAVLDPQDRLLLAHNMNWKPGRVSLVAGYVDAGEDLENAVIREVKEEVGLDVQQINYVTSQPWPFPRSLMIAFTCSIIGEQSIKPDGREIEWARFYTRDQLISDLHSGNITIPASSSIAKLVIERWLNYEL